ncbi:hypothetical protein GJA_5468 [Janthinobacterium agaricidamnosum NBRC 102515 = DSM 9628]|uniref:Uncharacterized protein n=1 Tax=Janthinobacterium agaricidamnosum NBRC 102515 = DSM 9628 TaxID=1349767 RepID=W0VB85_9BURK|nr:hypothetical protein GJA_5468 [Janthinobacterium agaricidamnosum NBRC 102515 = DSM 9628]
MEIGLVFEGYNNFALTSNKVLFEIASNYQFALESYGCFSQASQHDFVCGGRN